MSVAWQVVYGHLDDPENEDIRRGISYLRLRPGEDPLYDMSCCPIPSSLGTIARHVLEAAC